MDYFKGAEEVLRKCRKLNNALVNIQKRIDRLIESGAPREVKGVDCSKEYIDKKYFNDTYGTFIELQQAQIEKVETEKDIKIITDVLNQLSPEKKSILELWYVKGMTKNEIGVELHIASTRIVYEKRNAAVSEFALLYYGSKAG